MAPSKHYNPQRNKCKYSKKIPEQKQDWNPAEESLNPKMLCLVSRTHAGMVWPSKVLISCPSPTLSSTAHTPHPLGQFHAMHWSFFRGYPVAVAFLTFWGPHYNIAFMNFTVLQSFGVFLQDGCADAFLDRLSKNIIQNLLPPQSFILCDKTVLLCRQHSHVLSYFSKFN